MIDAVKRKVRVWDWLFGTAYLPAHKPKAYGHPDRDYPKEAGRRTSDSTSTSFGEAEIRYYTNSCNR